MSPRSDGTNHIDPGDPPPEYKGDNIVGPTPAMKPVALGRGDPWQEVMENARKASVCGERSPFTGIFTEPPRCARSAGHTDMPYDFFPPTLHLAPGGRVWPVNNPSIYLATDKRVSVTEAAENMAVAARELTKADKSYLSRLGHGEDDIGTEDQTADESFWVNIGIPAHVLPQHTQELLRDVVAPSMHRFAAKNVEYGETANHLGSKGQFADINRKFGKLKRLMWDQNVPEWAISEGVEEVLQDLIGHCILSIHYIRQETSDEA